MKSTSPNLWTGQLLHFLSLLILLPLTWMIWSTIGEPFPLLFWTCIAIPTLHQIYVWLTWRLELQSGVISKSLGFGGYKVFFFILLIARPVSLLALAWLDANSLGLSNLPRIILTTLLILPAAYTMYSVKKYFGFARAAGADHFIPKYRSMPLAEGGIFKYTNNGMYIFGFMMLWAIAIGFNSKAALLVAAFSHLSIWVHYFATEKPDMDYLYGME